MQNNDLRELLTTLRAYALSKGARMYLQCHREDSRFIRLANSAVSLSTSEALLRLTATAYGDHRKASAGIMCGVDDLPAMKRCLDQAIDMLPFASELSYQPTLAEIGESTDSRGGYDPALADMYHADILAFVEEAAGGLDTDDLRLSGNFSSGVTEMAAISTQTPHTVYWQGTDAQVTLVLSSLQHKWEINAEQSVAAAADLDAAALRARLAFLKEQYLTQQAIRLEPGKCRVVFGPAATAEYLSMLGYLGLSGAAVMRGMGMYRKEDIGRQVMNSRFTLTDDPAQRLTFAWPYDLYGRRREQRAWYDAGVLKGFSFDQDTADEYNEKPTGDDVPNLSLVMSGGDQDIAGIQELAQAPRDVDILYAPYLHYMGVVNPSEGLITGTTRFGALWLPREGGIRLPYNVRFTEKLSDIFGAKLRWLSRSTEAYNLSNTYGARNPVAVVVPSLLCADDVSVELSNESF
ncbi:MAG: metallopeptidase TldD-related protein [Christensenellales bacterium]|jgi:predicted Zn-dependent protease